MSTRYVWGKYTRDAEQVLVDGYQEQKINAGSKKVNDYYNSDESTSYFYIYRSIRISQSNGSISGSSGARYYTSNYSNGDYVATGYMSVSGDSDGYEWLYGTWYKGDDIWTGGYAESNPAYGIQSQYYTYYDTYYVRGSLTGYLSSSSRNAYPNNDYSGSIWYYYQGQDSIDAASVILSDNIEGGQTCNVTINPSTNKEYSGTVTYSIYYRYDGGSWNYFTATTSTNTMISVPKGTNSIQVRVQAKDDLGFTSSDYTTSELKEVSNGSPPYIQWSYYVDQETEDYILHDARDITEPFTFNFTPTDPDNDSMTLYEGLFTLNEDTMVGEETIAYKETSDITSGLQRTSSLLTDENVYLVTPLDKKCGIILRLKDAYNMNSKNYIVAFKKVNDEVTIKLKTPMKVQGDITKGTLYLFGYFPEDATITVKVTNGANDEEIVWKDISQEALTGKTFEFDSPAQNGSAFSFEVYAKRGTSKEVGYIDTIIGAFE